MKNPLRLRVLFLVCFFAAGGVNRGGAEPPVPKKVNSLKNFQTIQVLHDGRIKPLDTYARTLLLQFSGRSKVGKEPAVRWLARFLLAPETTRNDKIFLVNNPQIVESLGIPPEHGRRYSFAQMEAVYPKLAEMAAAAFRIEDKQRDLVENEIIRVHENVRGYADLTHSFQFAFPHPDFEITSPRLRSRIGLPEQQAMFSFIEVIQKADKIYAITQPLEKKPMAEWGEDEKKLAGLMSQIYQWSASYQGLPFTVVPSYLPNDERWMSPWDIFQAAFKTTEGREEAVALRDLMVAYWNGEQIPFDLAAKHFQQSVRTRYQSTMGRDLPDGKLEIAYNKANLFLWTKISYALAFLVFLFSLVSDKKYLYPLAWGLTVAGFVTQTIGLGMRIAILGRPPVSNLYETFVFVSFMIGLSGMIIERLNRQWLGLVVSAIGGFVFLLIANKFASEGDTLRMLVAVLNSNFWLSTHVLSITTGYAGACVAGIIGHIYILQAIFKPNNKALQERTSRVLLGALGFGLAMTFLGTNLGGIWADESWGRFWGWDPKENGALLIILWIAMIFHARLGGLIGPLGVAASSVLVLIVVMWAWFGVNLLSIGLHSYGFMQGVATNLAVYVTLQLLFLSITIPIALGRQHANKSSKT